MSTLSKSIRHTSQHTHTAGFSLISLMLACALMGILVSLALMEGSFLDRLCVQSELMMLHSCCLYARQHARMKQQPVSITYDKDKNSYTYGAHTHTLTSRVLFGTKPGVQGPPSHPTTPITAPTTFAHNQLTVTPQGIVKPGTFYVTDVRRQFQYALTIAVSSFSYARCYVYDGKWHPLALVQERKFE